jgi:hypothetical protein
LPNRRNFIIDGDPLYVRLAERRGDDATMPEVAVITEARFANRQEAENLIDGFIKEDVLRQVLQDEDNFIQRGCVRRWVVHVCE